MSHERGRLHRALAEDLLDARRLRAQTDLLRVARAVDAGTAAGLHRALCDVLRAAFDAGDTAFGPPAVDALDAASRVLLPGADARPALRDWLLRRGAVWAGGEAPEAWRTAVDDWAKDGA